jgi:hypothetical protein
MLVMRCHSSSKLKGGGSSTALDPARQGAGAGDPREILVDPRRCRQPLAFRDVAEHDGGAARARRTNGAYLQGVACLLTPRWEEKAVGRALMEITGTCDAAGSPVVREGKREAARPAAQPKFRAKLLGLAPKFRARGRGARRWKEAAAGNSMGRGADSMWLRSWQPQLGFAWTSFPVNGLAFYGFRPRHVRRNCASR